MPNPSLAVKAVLALSFICAISSGAESNGNDTQHWLKQLESREPEARQEARRQLMGLSPADLPQLRTFFTSAPCHPAQADALEEIVTYIMTRENLSITKGRAPAFLGLAFLDDRMDDTDSGSAAVVGVAVRPLLGFVGERYLEDGDVIVGFGTGDNFRPTRDSVEFREALRHYAAGDLITVRVSRGATLHTFTFPLDGRPEDASNSEAMVDRIEQANGRAEAYWAEQFVPVLFASR